LPEGRQLSCLHADFGKSASKLFRIIDFGLTQYGIEAANVNAVGNGSESESSASDCGWTRCSDVCSDLM